MPVSETGSGVELTLKTVWCVVSPSSSVRFEGDLLADLGLLDLFCTSLVLTLEPVVSGVELNVEGAVSTIGSRSGLCASFGTDVGAVPFAGKVDVIIADVQIHMKY